MNTTWENRQGWVWGLGLLLLLSGYLAGVSWPARFDSMLAPSLEQLRKLAVQTGVFHSVIRTVLMILIHNLFAAIIVMIISGILTAGIYPAWAMWMNGLTMGYVVAVESQHLSVPAWRIFVYGMLPHGLFELPAFIWCGVMGIRLGYFAVQSLWWHLQVRIFPTQTQPGRGQSGVFRSELKKVLKLLPYPIGLLVIAATIEGTVTPHLIVIGIQHFHK